MAFAFLAVDTSQAAKQTAEGEILLLRLRKAGSDRLNDRTDRRVRAFVIGQIECQQCVDDMRMEVALGSDTGGAKRLLGEVDDAIGGHLGRGVIEREIEIACRTIFFAIDQIIQQDMQSVDIGEIGAIDALCLCFM